VLLKNQNSLLPLDAKTVKRIAVVGNLAKYAPPTGFGSANVMAANYISELSGLQQLAPNAKVEFIDELSLDQTASKWTHTDNDGNSVKGLKTEFFSNANWSGDPAATRTDTHVDLDWSTDSLPVNGDTAATSIRYSGQVTPTVSGEQVFKVRADGAVRLYVNGQKVLDNGDGNPLPNNSIPPTIPVFAKVNLEAGKPVDIKRLHLDHGRPGGRADELGLAGGAQGPGPVRRGTGGCR